MVILHRKLYLNILKKKIYNVSPLTKAVRKKQFICWLDKIINMVMVESDLSVPTIPHYYFRDFPDFLMVFPIGQCVLEA